MREEADSAWAEKGALGVRGHGRQGAAGTKYTPRKKFCQGSAQGSARWCCMREKEAESSKTAGGQRRGAGRKQRGRNRKRKDKRESEKIAAGRI